MKIYCWILTRQLCELQPKVAANQGPEPRTRKKNLPSSTHAYKKMQKCFSPPAAHVFTPENIAVYHLESRWCNSHVLVYHGPLLSHLLGVASHLTDFHCTVCDY